MKPAALLAVLAAVALAVYVRRRRDPVPARWEDPADGLPPTDPYVLWLQARGHDPRVQHNEGAWSLDCARCRALSDAAAADDYPWRVLARGAA